MELAIIRAGELAALRRPKGAQDILPFQFLIASKDGFYFFIEPRGFSSIRLRLKPVDLVAAETWEWEADANLIREARVSRHPAVLFLFDADLDPGRYLRLDTLPEPSKSAKTVVLSFPVENTITGESIHALADEIAKERLVPASA
jgi:hypothetical protein